MLVTGASGFVGSYLCSYLEGHGIEVVRVVRRVVAVGEVCCDLRSDVGWGDAMNGVEVVVHCAGVAGGQASVEEYNEINVLGSKRVARFASDNGVRRFVFISSIKAMGEISGDGLSSVKGGVSLYGQSKLDAEEGLLANMSGEMDVVIIRPPVVYGPGVGGTLRQLEMAIRRGVWLPFGSISNSRDMVSLRNLCDFVFVVASASIGAGQRFYVSDKETVSISGLIRRVSCVLGRQPRLINISPAFLKAVFCLLRRESIWFSLGEDLTVDIGKSISTFGWEPMQSFDEGLKEWLLR